METKTLVHADPQLLINVNAISRMQSDLVGLDNFDIII